MNKEVDLSVSCYGKVKDRKYDIVILPWGATEPHNLHLPYMTDCILSHDVAVDAALIAKQKYGVNCMVMPPIGMCSQNPGQRELPFCIRTRLRRRTKSRTGFTRSLDLPSILESPQINSWPKWHLISKNQTKYTLCSQKKSPKKCGRFRYASCCSSEKHPKRN